MTESNETLLNLSTVQQPFDLATALKYMKENGEFIRCKTEQVDFYMYRDTQRRPVFANGKRKWIEVETVWAFNQWGGTTSVINVADLFNLDFYIMKFDEQGNPDWSDPKVDNKEKE